MVEKINDGDFIEIEYTGKVKDSGEVFDSTHKEEVEKINPKAEFGPVVIVLGKKHLIKGLDVELKDKEVGKDYSFSIPPELGFGKKDPQLITLVNTSKFRESNINPAVGMTLNVDGVFGTVKNVTGGRTLIDFNHPLSGKELFYNVKVLKKITDDLEKLKAVCKNMGFDASPSIKDGVAEIKLTKPTDNTSVKDVISKSIKELIPGIKDVKVN